MTINYTVYATIKYKVLLAGPCPWSGRPWRRTVAATESSSSKDRHRREERSSRSPSRRGLWGSYESYSRNKLFQESYSRTKNVIGEINRRSDHTRNKRLCAQ